MNNNSMSIIDLLSVICFYLTIENIEDNKSMEQHLKLQDKKIDKILEVLENDNR